MLNLVKRMIDPNERELARLWKLVRLVNAEGEALKQASDAELRARFDELRQAVLEGKQTLDDVMVPVYAIVREVSDRKLGLRPFDVQIMGAIVLHQRKIAEMKTGEGKTLVAVLPLCLNALEGKGCHLVTVNEYLAEFHRDWMSPVYEFLGLSAGVIKHDMEPAERREAYNCDITYSTNAELGFDYLRDNLATSPEQLVQRDLHYAIIDEVDSILIDEARTPLILSGPSRGSVKAYLTADRVVRRLKPELDYTVDEKARTAMLTEEGQARVEKELGIENLADPQNMDLNHYINNALKAHAVYKRDVDYVVQDKEVVIVDEFTGRLMFGRRYSDGLHQAIEAKEGVPVRQESQTLASITLQNFFRLYDKLAGMTGTAKTEEGEFLKIYGLPVVVIPTNRPVIRKDYPDVIHKTMEAKFRGLTAEVIDAHLRGQPVLVGTRSIEINEKVSRRLQADKLYLLGLAWLLRDKLREKEQAKEISNEEKTEIEKLLFSDLEKLSRSQLRPLCRKLGVNPDLDAPENKQALQERWGWNSQEVEHFLQLTREGIPHNLLNAKNHAREAEIIAQAGRYGAVTVATNMAGRGVDIVLGGQDMPDDTEPQEVRRQKVLEAGGLYVIGSERHESRRIDNQLRGRSGRQGDPGASKFFVSLEDELMRLFGPERFGFFLNAWPEDEPITHKIISRQLESAQKKVESHNFDIRKQVLQYDDIMNTQRKVIYAERRKVLMGEDFKDTIVQMMSEVIDNIIETHYSEKLAPEDRDLESAYRALCDIFPIKPFIRLQDLEDLKPEAIKELVYSKALELYQLREEELGAPLLRHLERMLILQIIHSKWIDHLKIMDDLREGIGLRGYAQVDPFVEYSKEAHELFMDLLMAIREDTVRYLFRIQVEITPQATEVQEARPNVDESGSLTTTSGPAKPVKRKQKVGRNDPCPCGSGKKYKNCCLKKERRGGKVAR